MDGSPQDERRKIGPYRLEERLAAGGMGEVYRAYDERLERRVALKQIRPEAAGEPRVRERFLREARVAARLNHPALVQIYDILETQGELWIVMEFVEGETVAELLDRGPLKLALALPLAREIATGLAAAHNAGIMHRDLKAENVVRTPDGHAKILDFGLAKPLWHMGSDASLTIDGQLLGTPRSMSPEQALGQEIDHRSDLFSLGTLFYEMLTRASPFVGDAPEQTLQRVCHHRQVPARELVPEIPQGLSDLIDLLLSKDPSRRPQTAGKVVSILDRVAESPDTEITLANLESVDHQETLDKPGEVEATKPQASEQRRITVVCCDLVSISSNALDAETLYEVMPEFQALADDVIGRFAGHVGTVLGHRLVIYFGYPQPMDDHAPRSVRTALELLTQVGRLNQQLARRGTDRLAVRIGIHTGTAVVMDSLSQREQLALGETLDLANGIQGLAEANGLVVSETTAQEVEGQFVVEELPPAQLHGFSRAIAAYRVIEPREAQAPQPQAASSVSQQELELLLKRWQLAKEGTGQVVLLGGQTGGGRSQLLRSLKERLACDKPRWLIVHGSALTRTSPLQPILQIVRRLLKLDPQGSPAAQLAQLERGLDQRGFASSDVVPLLAPLLSLPLEGRYPMTNYSPERRKAETLEALVALLLEGAEEQPVVLIAEDVQWMDSSTLDLLGLLIDEGEAVPLLLLLTFEQGFVPPWRRRANLTQLNLRPGPTR